MRLKFTDYDKKKRLTRGISYDCECGFDVDGKAIVIIDGYGFPRTQFVNPEATTGASAQGDTIDTPFCIFEAYHYFMTWKAIHTAILRATCLANVYIYIGPSTTAKVISVIKRKIKRHMEADEAAGREWGSWSEYVDKKWVCDTLKKNNACCSSCGDQLSLDYEPHDPKQWSINRLNNKLAHTKRNCEIICLSCNHGSRDSLTQAEEEEL